MERVSNPKTDMNTTAVEFFLELENSNLDYEPSGTCDKPQCGGVRSRVP